MKAKYYYDLTFKVGGVAMSYADVAVMCGCCVGQLTKKSVYITRDCCEHMLRNMGFTDIESEIKCMC